MAKFIGELSNVSTRTSKKGVTETVVTFRIDNGRYGQTPDLRDFQGLPCLIEIIQKKEEDGEDNDTIEN
ncbi:MAG: hypothetical protein M0Q13_14950 [Methanothrix sp.]|jgi:hypothetical protein|nr:hypothetical protein [Methanothrix sp.]